MFLDSFAFLLKTYQNDWDYTERLVESFEKHNSDHIHLYMVVDSNELELFEQKYGNKEDISVISKENIGVKYVDETDILSAGYLNQEIVKLSFWKLGMCKNYSCIDSELIFIRDFTINEFMYDEEIPYTVLFEDKDLEVNPNYYEAYWCERQKKLDIIKNEFNSRNQHLLTCHGMQTFNSKTLEAFEKKYMMPKNLSYVDLVKISPYEFTWYNYFLQEFRPIDVIICEPHFKTYHMPYQQAIDIIQGINLETLKRSYCGIIINSNYSRDRIGGYDDISSIDWSTNDLLAYRMLRKVFWNSRKKIWKKTVERIVKIALWRDH